MRKGIGNQIEEMILAHPDMTFVKIAENLGTHQAYVSLIAKKRNLPRRATGLHSPLRTITLRIDKEVWRKFTVKHGSERGKRLRELLSKDVEQEKEVEE